MHLPGGLMKRGERHQLGAVIEEVGAWVNAAQEARQLAAHQPVSGTATLSPDDGSLLARIEQVAATGALDTARRLTKVAWPDARKRLQPSYEAADYVAAFHHDYRTASAERLAVLRAGLAARAGNEREHLRRVLAGTARASSRAWQMRDSAAHLPMTRTRFGALTGEEAAAAQSVIQVVDAHHKKAALLLDPSACRSGGCGGAHASARVLAEFDAKARQDGIYDLIEQAATRATTQLSSELARLPAALADLGRWRRSARQALADAEHLPVTRTDALSEREAEVISALTAVYDVNIEAARAFHPSLCRTGACAGLHQPVAVLCAYQAEAATSGDGDLVLKAASRLTGQIAAEHQRLEAALNDLDTWHAASREARNDAEHMPLTRSGVLTDSEQEDARLIDEFVARHRDLARALLDATDCGTGSCHEQHRSGAALVRFHEENLQSGTSAEVLGAAQRVAAQTLRERARVADLHARVTTWPGRVEAIRRPRTDAAAFVESRARQLADDSAGARIGRMPMRLFPVQSEDGLLVMNLALLRLRPLLEADEHFLTETVVTAQSVLSTVSEGLTFGRCRGDGRCAPAHSLLPVVYGQADAIEDRLDALRTDLAEMPYDLGLLGDSSWGFTDWLPGDLGTPEWLEAAGTLRARRNLPVILNAASIAKEAAEKARAAAGDVRAEDVASALRAMDLDVLRKASPEVKFRVAPLEHYGVRNVWDVLEFQEEFILDSVPGLGESSAKAITQAALRLHAAVRDDTPVRIDVKRRSELTATLLEALRRWDSTRKFRPSDEEVSLAEALATLFQHNAKVDRILAVTGEPAGETPPRLNDVLASALDRVAPPPADDDDIWLDFLSRPADYFGMLTELGFTTQDEKKMHGDLSEEIIEAVRAKELKRDHLTASLRAYQSFGARFVLAQEKVVIGDEMGLGKTVEALAVFAHLRATGHAYFLVVCPAAVVTNWTRETEKHTNLTAVRLHGSLRDRDHDARNWILQGGVAVTTYDLLPWALQHINQAGVACAVFDEAHYIKNPNAKRSRAAAKVIGSVKYAILMTGTPMENSVQEFRNLIGYIRSDLAESAPEFLASKFRKHVAPVYLRRNQEDVLPELPDLVEIDEWLDMSRADERAYREAVQQGTLTDMGRFANMRRAAMLSDDSRKMERLLEIVAEAKENGHRVLVFSYFLDVLAKVKDALPPGQAFGPLTGATPATSRPALVDRFSKAEPGAVLVGQIKAAGEGLNIQSASIVIICEPQLTPTMEAQAIARAHRMGQQYKVQAYRLLTVNSVDERIYEIVAPKRRSFDEFVRVSVIAEQAPDSIDISEGEIARKVVAAERERLTDQT